VLIIWSWRSSSLFFSSKCFALAFSLLSFSSSRLIASLILSKSVLKTPTTFPLAFVSASSLSSITYFLYSLSYCSTRLYNYAWVFEDISTLSWQSLKLVIKASSSVLVCIQCVLNSSCSFSARFLTAFSSSSYFSKNMIFLSFFSSCCSINFLNFSLLRSCSLRDILGALCPPPFGAFLVVLSTPPRC